MIGAAREHHTSHAAFDWLLLNQVREFSIGCGYQHPSIKADSHRAAGAAEVLAIISSNHCNRFTGH
jgi:hypothetical protein